MSNVKKRHSINFIVARYIHVEIPTKIINVNFTNFSCRLVDLRASRAPGMVTSLKGPGSQEIRPGNSPLLKEPFSAFKSVSAGTTHELHSVAESPEEQNAKRAVVRTICDSP